MTSDVKSQCNTQIKKPECGYLNQLESTNPCSNLIYRHNGIGRDKGYIRRTFCTTEH
jgi:hypothetical protein